MSKIEKLLIKMKFHPRINYGFTLIELLVVISIIGILASLTLVSYSGAQKQTRDTQRKSDLAQYRNGLENFAANNSGMYPYFGNETSITGSNSPFCQILRPNYISACPLDPTGTYAYRYRSNGSGSQGSATATRYVLWAQLETGGYWVVCSEGQSGKVSSQPNPVGGSCPLSS